MRKGICPRGHLEQTGKIGDKCQYKCSSCLKECQKKLKSWSSGYMFEQCSCKNDNNEIDKSLDKSHDLLICSRGHKASNKKFGDICQHKCQRCYRLCDHIVQGLECEIIYKDCECYNESHRSYSSYIPKDPKDPNFQDVLVKKHPQSKLDKPQVRLPIKENELVYNKNKFKTTVIITPIEKISPRTKLFIGNPYMMECCNII